MEDLYVHQGGRDQLSRLEESHGMNQGIFISYRRSDSSGYAHALATRLVQQLGDISVFMDVDSLEPGVDFVETISNSLSSCSIVLALIGKDWVGIQADGRRRIDNDSDYVRAEIADALARGIRVIPILIDNAVIPELEDLPTNLKPLVRRQAIEWSNTRFNIDLDRIADAVKKVVRPDESKKTEVDTPTADSTAGPEKAPAEEPDTDFEESDSVEAGSPNIENQADLRRRPSISHLLGRLFFLGVVVLLIGYGSLVFHKELDQIAGIFTGGINSPSSRPEPTYSAQDLVSKEHGSLHNFNVSHGGKGSKGDFIHFTVEFDYVGPASKVCVGGLPALDGKTSKNIGYNPYCQPVISGRASGTARVKVSRLSGFLNIVSNQVNVHLFVPNGGKNITQKTFTFHKSWGRF